MSIVTTQPRTVNILSLSYEAAASLTSLQYCAVAVSGASSGKMKITTPSAGGLAVGILQTYNCASGSMGEVMVEGVSQAIAYGTFNSGVELAVAASTGKLTTASAGNYVVAIAEEAATAADQVVTVRVVSPYQKNA